MYIIKADGKLLYSPELINDGYKVYSPKLHLEVNAAGSLDFTLPPCNALYNAVRKMKSILTVEQDGEEIFRGRLSEETVDTYNQRQIYCEGDLSFLLDSLQAPFTFEGTQKELFEMLVSVHNTQMDADKRFVVGITSGLDNEKVIKVGVISYADTSSTIQTLLLDVYGGFLQTRKADGVYYLDYLDEYSNECKQKIEFGVNLVDIESQVNAQNLCTVLVPLGAITDAGTALTIADVNDGKAYIENTAAIELYGRIYKTYTWDQVTDPAQLLELGKAYMQSVTMEETLTLKAVDMYLVYPDAEPIRKGDRVNLLSKPHGLDRMDICVSMDIDLQNDDNTIFVFGLQKQTMADQAVATTTQLNRVSNDINDQHRWLTETDTALNIAVETINLIGHRTSAVEVRVDAAEAAITFKAEQDSVDILGERMGAAELRIDGAESAIKMKADRTEIQGFLTVDDGAVIAGMMNSEDLNCNTLNANSSIATEYINAYDISTAGLTVGAVDVAAKLADLESRLKALEG